MAKQVVEEFPEIPASKISLAKLFLYWKYSTEMMSQYRKSLAKEILLASGIKHFEQFISMLDTERLMIILSTL